MVAAETCEELWTPRSPHVEQYLAGVEIIGNGSASHHQLRKLDQRVSGAVVVLVVLVIGGSS
jgi:NAD+ synthase (glutamine-hydrolysing)